MQHVQDVLDQVSIARRYAQDMLSHVDSDMWFQQPAEGVTHIAWQVGHLAVAQYGLALKRVRGEQASDAEVISPDFRQAFGKGSVPQSDPAANSDIEEIRSVFDRVHTRVMAELPDLPEAVFQEPSNAPPHPMFQTKLGAVLWSAQHEFIHIGQIALIRRLLGQKWLR